MVREYLRGQNMEQLGRREEAIAAYEQAVEGAFDATGPYDRLIALYADQALHDQVIRVAEMALANVRTYQDKRDWYQRMRDEAAKKLNSGPRPTPRQA